jgi:carboxypeptidase Taq
MWENVIGRSRDFWQFFLPQIKEVFPAALEGITLEEFYRAINRVQPGLIRVEADEVTYNLHIFLRFEIETDLLERKVRVSDLPELWNVKMQEYLGLTPPNDALGVLQDVHWSGALLGYFPTYALGNLLSVQFYEQALSEVPEIPDQIARGEFGPLVGWLHERIHRHGAKFTPAELVERVTGSSISPRPFLKYLKDKYGEIYGL